MTGIISSFRSLVTTTFVTGTDVVGAVGKSVKIATSGIDALDHKTSAFYESVKAEAFTYKEAAIEEAIHRETARHTNTMAELELDMRRDPQLYAAYEAKAKSAMEAYKAHVAEESKEAT